MKNIVRMSLLLVAILASIAGFAQAKLTIEEITFTSSLDGTGPLNAKVVFKEDAQHLPMMVVQHGYWGNRDNVLFTAQRMAERGYFCVCIDTRGWGGSAGKHDDGGVEIMDIYDGMKAAAEKYGDKVDMTRASIAGYSNGGANVFFSLVRFPYLFRSGLAFFGIPDYGMWTRVQPGFSAEVYRAVGGTPVELPDKYTARNAILAAGNLLSGTHLHIAYDEEEKLCPIPMDDAFVAAAKKAGVQNVFVNLSKITDKARWTHGYNDGHLSAMEDIFLDDLEKSKAETIVMPESGKLVVAGFVVTPRFTCILGSGENAAAEVKYDFTGGRARFVFRPLSKDKSVKAKVILHGFPTIHDMVAATGDALIPLKFGEPLVAETTLKNGIIWFRPDYGAGPICGECGK